MSATQVRNTVGQLVESGAIEGDKAVAWKKKLKDEKKLKKLRAKAEEGDAEAMYLLGCAYGHSEYGLQQDDVQERVWMKRAAELQHTPGMAAYGHCLLNGVGGTPIPALGLIYTTLAADRGSRLAAYTLCLAYLKGHYGVPRDTAQAKFWLSKVVDDGGYKYDDLSDRSIEDAKKQLQAISS